MLSRQVRRAFGYGKDFAHAIPVTQSPGDDLTVHIPGAFCLIGPIHSLVKSLIVLT